MKEHEFAMYEYKEVSISSAQASFYLDCYENFGWKQDEHFAPQTRNEKLILKLKRNRKIANKVELTRLQRNFEADIKEIEALENSKTTLATILSLIVGILGTACMTGSVFAVTADPPVIWLCVLLAIPAFAGWVFPYFIFHMVKAKKTEQVTPYIEEKYDEIYEICEKGHSLL